ncbi:50S ribosomal protein L21e [Candidatus Bathyarchaeota archaeon]|nr:MAG: 50S ribosomal protein L21e [Candidatus Bathyarchaeota archaeon]
MKRSKGYRSKTRSLLRKKPRERGLKPLGYLLIDYKIGDRVVISIDPSTHKGQPHRRYHGKMGTIIEKRGKAYVVAIQNGGKTRKIIALPEHFKVIQTAR